jgi:hypothetical protein
MMTSLIKMRDARILYALVAQEENVLVDFSGVSGNFPTIARTLLCKQLSRTTLASNNSISYMYDSHAFHCLVVDGVTYLVSICLAARY